jgi:hypothetical protein
MQTYRKLHSYQEANLLPKSLRDLDQVKIVYVISALRYMVEHIIIGSMEGNCIIIQLLPMLSSVIAQLSLKCNCMLSYITSSVNLMY